MIDSTKNRLKLIMNERNLRQVDIINISQPLQDKYGIKLYKSHLSQYINGKSNPDDKKIFLLAKTLNVSEPWLMGYDVPMNTENKNSTIIEKISEITKKLEEKRQNKLLVYSQNLLEEQNQIKENSVIYNYISIYGRISAGTGNHILDTPVEQIKVKGIVPAHDIALVVSGDSMEPMFEDGDIVYIEKRPDLLDGQFGAFILDGEAYLKKLYCKDGKIRLVSLNKKYNDIEVSDYSELHVVGKVVI